MATDMLQYLDPDGLDETVLNIGEIKTNLEGQISALGESIEEEMHNLPYARPDGLYPDMTVGAVIGADETAQWATRESTGSGAATVRSVQGAAVVWNQLCESISAVGFVRFGTDTVTVQNHKYLFIADIVKKEAANNASVEIYGKPVGGSTVQLGRIVVQASERGSSIFTMSIDGLIGGAANLEGNYWGYISSTAQSASNGMLFDLTQMFGSGNEPTTVAEFEAMYPASYYPYSEPTLTPVRIAGIASTDTDDEALDSVEWPTYTLRAAGSVADTLYSDHVETRVGVVDLGTLTWFRNEITAGSGVYAFENSQLPTSFPAATTNLKTASYPCVGNVRTALLNNDKAMTPWNTSTTVNIGIRDDAYTTAADFKAAMSGVLLFYELATPTTTPISPLPMTYKVQAGGSESIIVPAGEVSAPPVLTVAEPVNMSTELARIWAAIESLGYTRNTAQLSRPVSLTDIGSIDEVQKDTTDVADIETTKEVQE